jgi:hypothetical protein
VAVKFAHTRERRNFRKSMCLNVELMRRARTAPVPIQYV